MFLRVTYVYLQIAYTFNNKICNSVKNCIHHAETKQRKKIGGGHILVKNSD